MFLFVVVVVNVVVLLVLVLVFVFWRDSFCDWLLYFKLSKELVHFV